MEKQMTKYPQKKEQLKTEPPKSQQKSGDKMRHKDILDGKKQEKSILESLLPKNIDLSDLMLAAVLFLLYLDSKDEDFLIILAVIALSVFKEEDI